MAIKVKFGFMVTAADDETGQECVRFDIAGSANAQAIINLDVKEPGAISQVVILPHNKPGQFNVIACSLRNNVVSYSFTNIADTQQLGEHLKSLGVKDSVIEVWNKQSDSPVPLPSAEVAKEASAAIARLMRGSASKPK